jgi:hypothetical protein
MTLLFSVVIGMAQGFSKEGGPFGPPLSEM